MKYFWLKDEHITTDQENKFIFAEEYPFNKNYYIIGYDYIPTNDDLIELSGDNIKTGNLNELYILEESDLYPTNYYYQYKMQHVINGPFPSITKATKYLNENKSTLLSILNEKSNGKYLNIFFKWGINNGIDFDVKVSILDEDYGYGFIKEESGKYASHHLDDTGAPGIEKISFNRSYLIDLYQNDPIEIFLRGRWFKTKLDGKINLIISSTKDFYKKSFEINIQSQQFLSNENFKYIGKVIYYPFEDRFNFISNL